MGTASPETYRGLLDDAWKTYEEALELVRGIDDRGFRKLVRRDDIDLAVEKLSEMKGTLKTKIKELKENSKEKDKYELVQTEIGKLLSELREKQCERNKP